MNLFEKGATVRAWAGGLLAGLAMAGPAAALPMASEGFWMVMAEAEGDERLLSANRALTGRDALGAAVARFESPGHGAGQGGERRETVALTYTRLLHRWNLPHAQANLWLLGQAASCGRRGWAPTRCGHRR